MTLNRLNPEILQDIIASIRCELSEVADGYQPAPTIDQLTQNFQASGYDTAREWVERAANELVVSGDIEGGTDPNRPIVPTTGFIGQVRAKRAAKEFPSDRTSIELIPHSPGQGPVWRLVDWVKGTSIGPDGLPIKQIRNVVEADYPKLTTVLKLTPWRVTWHAKVINEAIRKLSKLGVLNGIERVAGRSDLPREEPELQLRVYEDTIRVKRHSDDEVFEYDLRCCEWRALRALPTGSHL